MSTTKAMVLASALAAMLAAPGARQATAGPVVGVFFRGMNDTDPVTGMTMLDDRLAGLFGSSYRHHVYMWNVDLQIPEDFIYSFGPDRWVILGGYSKGGSAVTALSMNMWFNDLMDYQDDAVVTIDPVTGFYGSRTLAPGPDRGINLYQQHDLVGKVVTTEIDFMMNVNIGAVYEDLWHGNIHKDPRVLGRAVYYVRCTYYGRPYAPAEWESPEPSADWAAGANWSTGAAPSTYSLATLINTSVPGGQEVVVDTDATVDVVELTGVAGEMRVVVAAGATLTASVGLAAAGNGCVQLQGGTVATALLDVASGILCGTGMVDGDLCNAGTVAPGSSTGIAAITGDYRQDATGILEIEIGGTGPGSGYDQVNVAGAVGLDGAMAVSLWGEFDPAIADEFRVLTYGARSGTFAEITGWLLADKAMVPDYQADALRLFTTYYGDADLDTDVDLADLSILAFHWGASAGAEWRDGNFDADEDVDLADLSALAFYWGSAGTPPVPEPATLALLGLGACLPLRRRRR